MKNHLLYLLLFMLGTPANGTSVGTVNTPVFETSTWTPMPPPTPPTISSISPDSGHAGASATVTGANLNLGTVTVTVGGIAATNVSVVSATEVSFNTPVTGEGVDQAVVVTVGGQASTGAVTYDYILWNIHSVGSGLWHNTSTWDCNCVPNQTDTITIEAGHTISEDCYCPHTVSGQFIVNGTMDCTYGFTATSTAVVSGTGTVQHGGTINTSAYTVENTIGTMTFNQPVSIQNYTMNTNSGGLYGATVTINGTFTYFEHPGLQGVWCPLILAPGATMNLTSFYPNGGFSIRNGMINNGAVNIISGAGMDGNNGFYNPTIVNNGTWNQNVDCVYTRFLFENNGAFNMNGTGLSDMVSSNPSYQSTFHNNADGTLTLTSGTLNLGPFTNDGTVEGNGTLQYSAAVTNTGHFAPGLSPGTLDIEGNFENAVLDIEIETGSPVQKDSLHVAGNLVLTGSTLNVTNIQYPAYGSYDIISYTGTRTGSFATLNLPSGYTVTYDDGAKKVALLLDGGADADGDGYSIGQGDCNDADAAIHPGATETCDGLDNDCNGLVDDGFTQHPDYAALMALYNATDGANWTNNAGWVDGAAGMDCDVCNWYGVSCDNGRVVSLSLFINNLVGPLPTEIGNLTMLSFLSMLGNQLSGNIPASIGNLTNLETLELSENQFTGTIPPSLGNLTNLSQIQLNDNQLTGAIPTEIGNMSALSSLYFHHNQLSGTIPAALGNLANLNFLSLNSNQLTGSIPTEIGNLTEMVTLELQNNLLSGSIPAELGSLSNLEYVFLSNNDLSGCLPAEMLDLCAHVVIGDISGNPNLGNEDWVDFCTNGTGADADADGYCTGTGPNADCDDTEAAIHPGATEICNGLDDDCNGQIDDGLTQHPDYAALMALYNATDGANWTNNTGWGTTNCDVCNWYGVYCDGNGRVSTLILAFNQLTGSVPDEIGDLTNLSYLALNGNQLSGPIATVISDLSGLNLTYLDLSENQFTGAIPAEIGNFTTLESLTLANNPLSGTIPPEIGNLTNMGYLNLYANQLTGTLPPELGNLTNLASLALFNNQLSGCIPPTYSVFCNNGTNVYLFSNPGLPGGGNFTAFCADGTGADADGDGYCAGTGPNADCDDANAAIHPGATEICNGLDDDCNGQADDGFTQHPDYAALMALYNATGGANWTNNTGWIDGAAGANCDVCDWYGVACNGNGRVIGIDLTNNNLVGPIPSGIDDLTNLLELRLANNQLSGAIPASIGNISTLRYLQLSLNQLSGSIPPELGNLINLYALGLNDNDFSGTIPPELGNLANLLYLPMASNHLTGMIPPELGNLANLRQINLSYNELSGGIPPELGNLTNLTYLILSSNQLSGALPPELGNLYGLLYLYLSNNQLSGCIPSAYTEFCSGTQVFMSGNPGLPGGGNFSAFCANGTGADADGDSYCAGTGPSADCNDNNSAIHPGATEICNGLDDDCDGLTDESNCTITFSGTIRWEHDDVSGVNNADAKLTGSATANDLTDINGEFLIPTGLTTGSFTLKPVKIINKFNGVTAADATAIQQHVAQSNPITDPYKLVCADVNKNNSVSTVDAVLITQALLGNPAANSQFNTSWRFVPSSHAMQMPPWGFPEQRTYTNISGPRTNQDFVGMKIGDVAAVYANPANFGVGEPLVLRAKDRTLKTGETLDIGFTADQLDDLAAFQFALTFDPARLQFEAIDPAAGGLPLSAEHFGAYNATEGEIRVVWSQPAGVRVEEAAPAFRLRFTALQSGAKLSEVLRLDDAVLPALTYTSKLAESKVVLLFSETTGTNPAAAASALQLQVRPNPFQEETTVAFTLPAAGEAQLRVLDVNGRELLRINNTYPAGQYSETLRLAGVEAPGVLTCELITPFGVVTRKMVLTRL